MSSVRTSPALSVFPTLRRFPALQPRSSTQVPIGCSHPVKLIHVQNSIPHLYHDLGVLVFAGVTPQQIGQIGNILEWIVRLGGPGMIDSEMRASGGMRVRTKRVSLREDDVTETLDAEYGGVIKSEALLRLASLQFRQIIQENLSKLGRDAEQVIIHDLAASLPAEKDRKGILRDTVDGPRRLSVESYAMLGRRPDIDQIGGKVFFHTSGTGQYVGSVYMKYALLRREPSSQDLLLVEPTRILEDDGKKDLWKMQKARVVVIRKILAPMWALERQVWMDRAEQFQTPPTEP